MVARSILKTSDTPIVTRRRALFNPGPVSVQNSVRNALLCDDMNHREDAFIDVLRGVRTGIVELLNGTKSYGCVPFMSSGTGATQACISAIEGPVLALVTGRYSNRMANISLKCGHKTEVMTFNPLKTLDPVTVAKCLDERPSVKSLIFVHHETTTSVLHPLQSICNVARERGVITVVDAISSVFGNPIDLERAGPDFMSLSSNKGLESFAGLSYVVARRELLNCPAKLSRPFYFDLKRPWERMETEGMPPFTHSAPLYFAAREALRLLQDETVSGRSKRYSNTKAAIRNAIEPIGFKVIPLDNVTTSSTLLLAEAPNNFSYEDAVRDLDRRGVVLYTDRGNLAQRRNYFSSMGNISSDDIQTLADGLMRACHD